MKSVKELQEYIAVNFVDIFTQILDGHQAEHFVTSTVTDPKTGDKYEFTIRRCTGKTPAEMLIELQGKIDRLEVGG